MKISLDFRHPWSDLDHVAHIQREDLNGKQARRVISAAEEQLSKGVYSRLYADGYSWDFGNSKDPIGDWRKACEERRRLEALCERYEWRTYTVKELDDLTREEWDCIDPWELCLLSDFERAKYRV